MHKNYCMLGMDGKVSNFLLCLRDKCACSWKWSWIAISTWLWTHPWQHLILNTVLTLSPTGHMAVLKGSGLWHLEMISLWSLSLLSHQSSLITISNSFFSRRHYYAQNSSLECFYLCSEMVTVRSHDSLNTVCQYEFGKLLPSESFVWLLLAMLVLTDHLLQLLKTPLLFLVCSFSPFSHFQKSVSTITPSFLVSVSNSHITTHPEKCCKLTLPDCHHVNLCILFLFVASSQYFFRVQSLGTRVISRMNMNTELCKTGQ